MKKYLLFITTLLFSQPLKAQNKSFAGFEIGTSIIPLQNKNPLVSCDTIFSFLSADQWPTGLTYDGTYLWHCGGINHYIYKYNLSGLLVDSIVSPGITTGGCMDFDGTNLLVVVEEDGILYKINPLTGVVVSQFNLPQFGFNDPQDFGVAFDGTYIWHTTWLPEILYRLNANTGAVIDSFPLSDGVLAIKFINGKLYGIRYHPQPLLHQIDTTNGSYLSTTPWCLSQPLDFTLANNHVWAVSFAIQAGGTQRVYEFDSLLLNVSSPKEFFNDLQISPNPTNDFITIHYNLVFPRETIFSLFNLYGQLLIPKGELLRTSEQEIKIDMRNFAAGIYFVKMSVDGKEEVRKIVKY